MNEDRCREEANNLSDEVTSKVSIHLLSVVQF